MTRRHDLTDAQWFDPERYKLEEKGLIERAVDPADTRARRLRVTDRGAEVAQRAIEAVEAADAAFFAGTDAAAVIRTLKPLAGR
ncbi:hypothetical protein [Dactylosporangium sp. NPDC006015]|uniref:hypothetical protein n=1 Tax=Dactylosporangium sp. NPDC006015 TaxID=3154576 RepID=UPI0033A47F36